MPYNPGISDQSGQFLGQGILGAFNNFSRGMERYQQRQEENKQLESENKALELLTKTTAGKVGLPPEMVDQLTVGNPDESPRAKNARLKTTLTGVLSQAQLEEEQMKRRRMQAQMEEDQMKRRVMQAQMDQIAAAQTRDQRNLAAAQGAVAPQMALPSPAAVGAAFNGGAPVPQAAMQVPEGDEAVRRYIAAGGNDPTQARMLMDAAKPQKTARELQTITVKDEAGNPVSFVWDGASAPQRIGQPKATVKPLSAPGKLLADADALEKQGDKDNAKLLRDIAAKQGEDKPMTLTDYLISGGSPETFKDYVESFKTRGGAAAPAAGVRAALSAVDQQALDWANAHPRDPRAAKIKAKLGIQ
jgi:hypothetical protein